MQRDQINGNNKTILGWFSDNWLTSTSAPTGSKATLAPHPATTAASARQQSLRSTRSASPAADGGRRHLKLLSFFLLLALFLPPLAQAQGPGCCQFGRRCSTTQTSFSCMQAGGNFQAYATCNTSRGRCTGGSSVAPRMHVPSGRPSTHPITVQIVRPHGPHVVLVAAVTATPQPTPTATPTARRNSVGCCQLAYDDVPFCSAPTDPVACERNEGYFLDGGGCEYETGLCRPILAPPYLLGCCQQDSDSPSCANAVSSTQCAYVNGLFFSESACSRNSGFCVRPPLPRCGDGVVESGEECEADADCGGPAEGCTDTCMCAGGLEVLLRWTNENDVDLTVIDPRGNVYVPTYDANPACTNMTRRPEEFVFLPPGQAPIGCYTIRAHYDQQCPETRGVDTHLNLRLNIEGTKSTVHVLPGGAPGSIYETRFGLRTDCR